MHAAQGRPIMIALLIVTLIAIAGVVEAQYENPYAIKPLEPLKPYENPYAIKPLEPLKPYENPYAIKPYTNRNPRRNAYSSEVSSYSYTNPATVMSPEGDYLGNTSANKYDPDSINNPYGIYGSKYSPDSVNNPYGRFGSKYSPTSANNPYAMDTPQLVEKKGDQELYEELLNIINDGKNRGKLSANKYDPNSIENPYSDKYDKPLATSRQILRRADSDANATLLDLFEAQRVQRKIWDDLLQEK